MWVLVGIGVLVAGFAARLNPLLIVVAAALATGLAAGHDPLRVVAELGKAFNDNRLISIAWLGAAGESACWSAAGCRNRRAG